MPSPRHSAPVVVAQRVKNDRELRPGLSKLGCPSCSHDTWVNLAQLRTLASGGVLVCRNCQHGT